MDNPRKTLLEYCGYKKVIIPIMIRKYHMSQSKCICFTLFSFIFERAPHCYYYNYTTSSRINSVVLGRNANGGLLYLYEAAEYVSVLLSQAQANAMLNDPCVYAVEPNY